MELTTLHATRDDAGIRIDKFVAGNCDSLSRGRAQALMESGHILRNGSPCRPADTIRDGDSVTVSVPPPIPEAALEPEAIPLSILFEDSDLIVIDKPAGLVVHPGAGNRTGTLVQALLHHCKDLSGIGGVERPGIVHRLDRETSGCLVIAKNDAAHQSLAGQFSGRTVEKTYLAIAIGSPRRTTGTIDAPIGRHSVHRQRMTIDERGRAAVTDYKVLAQSDGLSLVECKPRTGRTHQIRVHLKSIGLPIAGDPVYGKRSGFERHLLHAWKLAFDHPRTDIRLALTAQVPADFPLVPTPR